MIPEAQSQSYHTLYSECSAYHLRMVQGPTSPYHDVGSKHTATRTCGVNCAWCQPRRVSSAVYAFSRPNAISDVAIDSDGMMPVVSSSCKPGAQAQVSYYNEQHNKGRT